MATKKRDWEKAAQPSPQSMRALKHKGNSKHTALMAKVDAPNSAGYQVKR